jgi:predicted phage tail protein
MAVKGIGNGNDGYYGGKVSNTSEQTAVVYDLLSEGPIEGLVEGAASIYLNGIPIINESQNKLWGASTSRDVSYNASTGVVTDNTSTMFVDRNSDEGTYYILIAGAKKQGSGIATTTADSKTVTTSTAFFASDDERFKANTTFLLSQYVVIKDAGANGADYIGYITEFTSSTEVTVHPPVPTTVSGKDIEIDLVDAISSFSGNTATLANGGGVNVSNGFSEMSVPTQTAQSTPKLNFERVSYAFRSGYRDQGVLPGPGGLGSGSIAASVGAELPASYYGYLSNVSTTPADDGNWINATEPTTGDTGIERTHTQMGVTNPEEVDQINITIDFPQGLYGYKSKNGREFNSFAEFQIFFSYTKDGSNYTETLQFGPTDSSINTRRIDFGGRQGKPIIPTNGYYETLTKTPFTRTFSFDIEQFKPFAGYKVKIKRVNIANATHGTTQQYNGTTVKAIENIIKDKLSYPYTAYGAVIFAAEEFTDIPTRGYHIRGLKCKVPTNYFSRHELSEGANASYTRKVVDNGGGSFTVTNESNYQDWDGNFRGDIKTFTSAKDPNHNPIWTDNPVWIIMDLLTNDRYGLGKYLDPDNDFKYIDKFKLFQIAKYCDELVPDGKGGTEPRFSANVYLKQGAEAQKVIKDLYSVFRGMLLWFDGQVSASVNAYKSPIYTFTKGNVVGGVFAYQSSSRRNRSNQIRVTWNNPDTLYEQDVEIVEDTENILSTGRINPKEVVAFGCTSQGQAKRFGKWHLLSEKLEKEVVSFETGLNAAFLLPGDVIEVQDADTDDVQFSGRVSTSTSSTTTRVYLDRAIDLSAASTTFELNLIYPKGGAYLSQVSAVINSTTYQRGDLILVDEDGAAVNTEAKANNVKDDNGDLVQLFWSEEARIETKQISSYNASGDVTLSSAFSEAPNAEVIWSITARTDATGEKIAGSPKEYVIISNTENSQQQTYQITAVEYSHDKFDIIDRGYTIDIVPLDRKSPTRTEEVPAPRSFILTATPGGADDTKDTESTPEIGLNLLASWEAPESTRLDVDGNAKTTPYEFIAGYEIKINIPDPTTGRTSNVYKTGPSTNSYTFKDIARGTYTAHVRTVNTQGNYSNYITANITIDLEKETIDNKSRIGLVALGGQLNQNLAIDSSTGLAEIGSSSYTYLSPNSTEYSFSSTGTGNYQQSFSGMGASATAYLLFDASSNTDKLKAVEVIENTTATTANGEKLLFQYIAELGASNDGLTAISGTITLAAGKSIVTGSSTSFTSEFAVGDKIFFGTGTSLFQAKINFIFSDTKIELDRVSTRSYSGATVSKLSFIPDFKNDAILARVATDGSTAYSFSQLYVITAGVAGAQGVDGAAGDDARAVNLTIADQTFEYDTNGANPSPSSATATATALNTSDTVYYEFFKNDVSVQNTTSNTYSYSAPSAYSSMPEKLEVQIREGSNSGTILARDQITISGLKAGTDAITTILSNEAHTLPTTSAGVVTYTDSGTDIEVWNGTTQVPYDGSSPYASPSFRVSASGSDITVGSASTVSTYTRQFADHNSMTQNNAVITYTIIVKNEAGVENTFTRKQTFAKSIQGADGAVGRTVKLIPSKHVINYSTAGAESDSITFTNEAFNFTTPYYRFLVDGVQKQAYSTTSTFTLADADEPAINEVVNVKVEVKENNTGDVAASDVVSIFAVQDGSDAVTGFLTNASHTVTANSVGTVSSFSGAGGTFKVFVGGTEVTTSCTFSTPSGTGVAGSINSSSGVYTITGMTADQGVRTFQAVIPAATAGTASNVTITADYSISKSIAGADGASVTGPAGLRTIQGYLYYEKTTSGAPSAPSGTTYTFSTGVVSGTGINDGGSTNVWRNSPTTQDAASSNFWWTVRYYGTEASAGSSTITVAYSNVVQLTNFSGVVTFSNGTFNDGSDITTIDGGNIAASSTITVGSDGQVLVDGANNRIIVSD